MKKIYYSTLLALLILSQIPVSQAQVIPTIDGTVEEAWEDAAQHKIEMTNGK